MIKICEQCSNRFEGGKFAHYCPLCRVEVCRQAGIRGNRKQTRKKAKPKKKKIIHSDSSVLRELRVWTVEYTHTRNGWIWKAVKGNTTLESAGYFLTLAGAQRDYQLAIGG